ncbi:MAG: hypothetical protein DRN25_01915 [Thermoplasmata archaeon]|nr:MAG: hypothetical protein DRN25_01915 [Thermoplasmata archaeon]
MRSKKTCGTIFMIVSLLMLSIGALSEMLYYYEGPDTTYDNISLEVFYVEGPSNLKEGSKISANFTLLNMNTVYIYNFTAFLKIKLPDGKIIEYDGVYREKLSGLEKISCNITVNLNMTGNWSIWPSYRFYEYPDNEGERIGPDYWHAYNFSVAEAFPDLAIHAIRYNEDKNTIEVVVENIGDADVSENFIVAMYVDEELIREEVVSSLKKGERKTLSVDASNLFDGKKIKFKAFADAWKWIDEKNENNNILERYLTPPEDTTPPHFVEGPNAENITFESAEIIWRTNEPCTGLIEYGKKLTDMKKGIKIQDLSTEHHTLLDNLESNTVYVYRVTIFDEAGNRAMSRHLFFRTLSYDDIKPTIDVDISENVSGLIEIKTNTSDNGEIDRVIFYIDNKPVYTDYHPPFGFRFNTELYSDGSHTFEARVFDAAGNMNSFRKGIFIQNGIPEPVQTICPRVEILSPADNSGVLGYTPIRVRVNHTVGIDRVEFWIDGELEHVEYGYREMTLVDPHQGEVINMGDEYEELPFEKVYDWYADSLEGINLRNSMFNESSEIIENKSTVIEVRAYDKFGVVGKDSITVYHEWASPPDASLSLSRRVHRRGHYFVVNVTIWNMGYLDADDVIIEEHHLGFQPGQLLYSDTPIDFEFTGIETDLLVTQWGIIKVPDGKLRISIPEIPAREYLRFSYELFPVLFNSVTADRYGIASQTIVRYLSDSKAKTKYYNSSFEPSPGWTAQEVINAFKTSDYLIVTNPLLLYAFTTSSFQDENELLITMAELAREKNGVLGYLMFNSYTNPPVYPEDIDNIIESWGKNYLNESWESEGYLLLVGEIEIIPSFVKGWDRDYDLSDETIYHTDYPYASTRGEAISPELHLGRIIGNTAADLIIPIRSSLDVHYGRAVFIKGQGGKAVCISGWGNGEGGFWSDIDNIGSKLQDAGFSVVKIRGSSYKKSDGKVDQVRVYNELRNNSYGASVIVYRNHGNDNGRAWSGVVSSDPRVKKQYAGNISFGNSRPLVFACCCCAGQYEDNPNYSPGGENGIAEAMLKIGAGVYIGSTEISMSNTNSEYSRDFFDRWLDDPDKSIAQAWKETRRYAADEWWFENDRYWSAEYQFYGDPKFGE